MMAFGRKSLVGAYVCPRGVVAIECKRTQTGLQVERTLEVPSELESPHQAVDHLVHVLQSAGVKRGEVAVALRGFGVVHHVLQMPPATDAMLTPIIEREVRRLEPQLGDCVVNWMPLPSLDSAGTEVPQQRSLLTAAAPSDVVQVIAQRLHAAGYHLLHLTALPAAMQRLLEEFDPGSDTTALVAALPDGAFIGFTLSGGLRLIVEPPLPQDAEHELPALGEEMELGIMFVRQQFRGAEIDRITIVGTKDSMADAESVLRERLQVPASRLAVRELSPSALAALGAVLDAESAKPLRLGGSSRGRDEPSARSPLETAAVAALVLLVLVGAWTIAQTVRTKLAASALETAQRRVTQDSFGLAPIRATANQRRLVRNAVVAMRLAAGDRVELQGALAGLGAAIRPPIQLDSLHLTRAESGWHAVIGGTVSASTNARAVQSLHDLYREVPRRLTVDSVRLDQLSYADSAQSDEGVTVVHFQLSFGIPSSRKD